MQSEWVLLEKLTVAEPDDNFLAFYKISNFLYRIHYDPPLVSMLTNSVTASQCIYNPLNAKLNPTCHLLALLGVHCILHVSTIRVKIHFNIILSSTYTIPRSPFLSDFSIKICYATIFSFTYVTSTIFLILLDWQHFNILSDSPLRKFYNVPLFFFNTLCSNTFNSFSFLMAR